MDVHKRGDHLVATGLAKTIGDIADDVQQMIGDGGEGRALHKALSECSRHLSDGSFDAVIDRGKPVLHDDPHSLAFGAANQALKLQMTSLLFALRFRRDIDDRTPAARRQSMDLANAQVATAKMATRLAVGHLFDQAIDVRVEQRLTEMGRGDAVAARASLERMRVALCRAIESL